MKRREMRVVRGKEKYPFSIGEVVESLQGAGVPTDDAIRIARDVDKHYRARDKKRIDLAELLARLASQVSEDVSPEVAERFRAQTPPFVPLTVTLPDEAEETFSRRALAGSLARLDLSFKESHAIARQVEQNLRSQGVERLDKAELALRVALALEGAYGRDLRLRYEAGLDQPTDLRVIEERGRGLPYSRGVLARSLMGTGLEPELSHNLAKRVEEALWRSGRRRFGRDELRDVAARLVTEVAGEEFARRYSLLRSVSRRDRPIVLLIGGAAGVGKSALAAELAYRLGVPRVVSTDSVRQALRSLISPELSPVLHSSTYAAWRAELLPAERSAAKPKRKRVIRGFQAQVQQLGTALGAILERNVTEATSLVLEGVHLVPGIVPSGTIEDATVIELVLVVPNEDVHRHHFAVRDDRTGQRRAQQDYLEHFDEIRVLQAFIQARAERYGVPAIDTTDLDQAVERALEHVLEVLFQESVRGDSEDGAAAADGASEAEGASGAAGAPEAETAGA